ncbi:hypothetical protein BHE74_00022969 [Ensete ventricosum]|nr:hypothetical protein GW17_00039062 [Ensete ventricosum]RWW69430.1 hypothetical protein BHE74_00022969 [Ensete ventricosum]RZR97255.1 hypothetical protein BHM03_00026396 [Ensete ventricosum]
MRWEPTGSSLGLHRRYWKIARNTPDEDRDNHRRECRRLPDCESEVVSLVVTFDWIGIHPKKIGSGHWCALRRRTREWT